MRDFSPVQRIFLGLLASVAISLLIAWFDFYIVPYSMPGPYINEYVMDNLVFAGIRMTMGLFVAVAVGAFIARRGFLLPILIFFVVVQAIGRTYAYIDGRNLAELDIPGAVLNAITAVVAVKFGEWVARELAKTRQS